eukprot:GHVP01030196.1.p1 GENE.GHVP01030196.1~~GHVP01030196.1.p1  ORF type:complete len:260 (+),score=51.28 GHVP01030196.1:40-819(+)
MLRLKLLAFFLYFFQLTSGNDILGVPEEFPVKFGPPMGMLSESLGRYLASFQHQEKAGITPSYATTTKDVNMSKEEKQLRMLACFRCTQTFFFDFGYAVKAVADHFAEELKLREDELTRMMFHSHLVTCYDNLDQKSDIKKFLEDEATEEDKLRVITREETTPFLVTEEQQQLMDTVAQIFNPQKSSPIGNSFAERLSGPIGIFYMLILFGFIVLAFSYGARLLLEAGNTKFQSPKQVKKDKKKEKKEMNEKAKEGKSN